MIKVIVLYGHPESPDAFEDYYNGTHMPIAGTMKNVAIEAYKVIGTPDGSTPPYYRIAELSFESPEQMQATLGSPEGQATVADIPNFATGGATVLIAG
ncbi:MAG TPA: EthD family reductase [Solirubrobacteraceae bacterium]|jgi:uncharacterized protein (TIGR02118 family)|nr:EthD family reductase [Solirubrobacteraceae bacterium]